MLLALFHLLSSLSFGFLLKLKQAITDVQLLITELDFKGSKNEYATKMKTYTVVL